MMSRFSLSAGVRRPPYRFVCLLRMFPLSGLLGLAPVLAIAEDQRQQDALVLPPLVITAVAQSSPVTVITDPRVPRQPVPASDGADYLKTIPGFAVLRNGGVNGDPVFRGMSGSRLNLLTNGGTLLGACPGRMDSPSSYITPESYDRLTVIKGPQTVLWGPGASAATVLFEREPERFDAPDARLHATLLAGSNGRFDRRIDAATGTPDGYLRLLANRSSADDYVDGAGSRVPSRFDKWSADLLLGWTPDQDTLLELSVGTGDGEARYAGRNMDGSQFLRESLALRLERDNLGEVWQRIEAQIFYNHADHVMDNFSLRSPAPTGMMTTPMASNVDRRTLGGRVAATWAWDSLTLQAGLDAQRNEHRARRSSETMGRYVEHDAYPGTTDAEFSTYGTFAEATQQLSDVERLIGGLRLDRAKVTDRRTTLRTGMAGAAFANPTADRTRSETLRGGFLRYERDHMEGAASSYLGLGHVERFPDYWELFSATSRPDSATAFQTVDPERTTQLDLGFQYQRGPLLAWASAYVGVVRDFILFEDRVGMMGSTVVTRNVDARIAGAEVGASYPLARGWKADVSLAYARGENRSDGGALPQMPPLEARLGLGREQGDWSASGLWRLVAAQHRVATNQGNVAGKDFDTSSGFGVLSANAAYRVSERLRLSLGIDNLLDKAYREHLNLAGASGFGYPANERIAEPGRTGWLRADMQF